MQTDPDYEDAVIGAFKLVEDAYARGLISWVRRCALLNQLAGGGSGLYETRNYVKPDPDSGVIRLGVFLEPVPAFLRELGLLERETAAFEQARTGIASAREATGDQAHD
ncbi:hypothetical protein [Methylobacterium mesophilicum]|uniref:hypothetical protein n=1 Tax=Methylobacterium mesophilicum TaxID=39956 RepID=UPI002F35D370